jgi:hypothetical protein
MGSIPNIYVGEPLATLLAIARVVRTGIYDTL